MIRFLLVFSLSLVVVAVIGCGPSSGSVSGTVSFSGQPIGNGSISFHGPESRVATAPVHDGKYKVDEVAIGMNKIAVQSYPASPMVVPPTGPKPVGAGGPLPTFEPLPAKFSQPDSSELTLDVKAGAQTLPIDIKQ